MDGETLKYVLAAAAARALPRAVPWTLQLPLDSSKVVASFIRRIWTAKKAPRTRLLDGPGVFATLQARRKGECASCTFTPWADAPDRARQFEER